MKIQKFRKFLLIIIGLILIISGLIVTTLPANAQSTSETEHDVGFYITDEDHTPLEGAIVRVEGEGYNEQHRTNQRGACLFQLTEGPYTVDIEHSNYESKTMKISITGPTTFTESLSKSGSDVGWLNMWGILFVIVVICIVLAILLFGRVLFKNKNRRRGGGLSIFVIMLIIFMITSNCGCLESILESVKKIDGSTLYSGKDNWFFTTLEWDIEVETYDSKRGPPEQYPTNKATEQLFSKYKITIEPVDPDDDSKSDVDSHGDGVPDGFQSDDDFVYGTAIYDSIPQAVNSVGYDGKLYNSVPRDNDHLWLADGINPQTESRSGIIDESERGVFSNIFMSGTDRPFLRLDGNFRDKFYENDIYITIPVTVEVKIKSNILKREIYSCQVDCPIFIHVPFPGHDDKSTERISLQLYVPLKFIGGGQITVKPQGSMIKGSAWINVPIPQEIIKDLISDALMQKAIEVAMVSLTLMLVCPIGLLVYAVFRGWPVLQELADEITNPNDPSNYVFIPGSRWHFDKGYLYKALEYLYNVLPSLTEPSD